MLQAGSRSRPRGQDGIPWHREHAEDPFVGLVSQRSMNSPPVACVGSSRTSRRRSRSIYALLVCSFRGLFACVLSWVEIWCSCNRRAWSAAISAERDYPTVRGKKGWRYLGDKIPAPVAIVRVHIIGSVLLTLGLPDYRALADVCLSQLTS